MFVCDGCLEDFENQPSMMRSRGTCEYCNLTATCNDIPLEYLRHRGVVSDTGQPISSRISVLFDGDQEPLIDPITGDPVETREPLYTGMHHALAAVLDRQRPERRNNRIRLLSDMFVYEEEDLQVLLQGYNIALIGDSDEEETCIQDLISRVDLFRNTRTLVTSLDPLPPNMNPALLPIQGFRDLAIFTGCEQEHRSLMSTMVIAMADSSSLTHHHMEDWVHSETNRIRSRMDYSQAFTTFFDALVTALQRKDEIQSDTMVCVVVRAGYGMGLDYSQLLRTLEKLNHPRLMWLLQMKEDLLEMCITATYARRFSPSKRITDEEARRATHNARHDMMRYTKLYHFRTPPVPEETEAC